MKQVRTSQPNARYQYHHAKSERSNTTEMKTAPQKKPPSRFLSLPASCSISHTESKLNNINNNNEIQVFCAGRTSDIKQVLPCSNRGWGQKLEQAQKAAEEQVFGEYTSELLCDFISSALCL